MSEEKKEKAIVKADSKAYGYNYASLADIVKQGFSIPQMRIMPGGNGRDYLEYQGRDGEWHIGAQIVVPEMKGMNAAQAYGSALTYARRYTAQMALSLACDDDQRLEKKASASKGRWQKNSEVSAGVVVPASEKQVNFLAKLLKDLGRDEQAIEDAKKQARAESSKTVSGWINAYQKKIEEQSTDLMPTEEELDEFA